MKSYKKLLSAVLALALVFSSLAIPTEVRAEGTNLALGKTAVASSIEAASVAASNAVDGNTTSSSSRWGSNTGAGPHWIYVDLGTSETVKTVRIVWEMRKATAYRIQTSDDAQSWTDVKVFNDRPAAVDDIIVLDEAVETRYVRLYIDTFTSEDPDGGVTWNSVSIYEMEIYGDVYEAPADPLEGISVETPEKGAAKLNVTIPEADGYTITYNGTDYEQVVDDDLTIYTPIVDTDVKVSFKIVNDATGDYEFKEIPVTVPGTYTQEEGDNAAPAIIPELREWKGYTGDFTVTDSTRVVIASDALKETADAFAADYEDMTGKSIEVVTGEPTDGDFYLALTEDTSKGLMEEGYILEIGDKVSVEAEDPTGAFWATRTILQALKQGDNTTIPKGITRDYPLYKVRGIILDVARKTFTLDYLKQMVKQMSWYKLNDFHVHLNDNLIFLEKYTAAGDDPMTASSGFRLESDIKAGNTVTLNGREFTYSADLTSTDVFYTKDEFRSFIQQADVYGVNIVPEFDTPAHSLALTKVLPDLRTGTNGRQNDHLDLANQYEECYDFVTGIFDEYLLGDDPVFDTEVIQIGCDEYEADGDAFRNFCNDMADYVKEAGYTPRIWGSLTSIKGTLVNGQPSVYVDGTGVQMNLWNSSWANMDAMYELGFDLINCNDGTYYMVPNAGYYYDYLNANTMYNQAVNTIGNVTIPAGDKQMLGASYAVWNDMCDIYENGVSEYDIYDRLTDSMALFAAKLWGKGDMTITEAQKTGSVMGDAPNTNFGYKVEADKTGKVAEFTADELKALEGVNAAVATVDDREALQLNGGESYVTTGLETVGLGSTLKVTVKRGSDSTEDQILFESPYGSIKAVQGATGKVGISRENRDYSFDYELPVGEWVELEFKNEFTVVSLYVNGELMDTLGDDETVLNNNNQARPLLATCMFPVAKIGSETNAFEGCVADVLITTQVEREYYDNTNTTVTASSQETSSEDAPATNAIDGDSSTFWHSLYSGTPSTPHWIELELDSVKKIDGLSYLPRSGGGNGTIKEYVIKVSTDGENYEEVASGVWAASGSEKIAEFDEVEAKYVRLEVVDSVGGFASAAEIKLRIPVTEEPSTSADKTALAAKIAEAEGLSADDYTEESFAALTEALDAAKAVNGKEDATQAEVNAAKEALQAAKDALVEKEPVTPGKEVCEIFTDVKHDSWYEDAVQYVYDKGLMEGNGDKFTPNGQMTRGMFVTTLYRLAGEPEVTDRSACTELHDVAENAWYTDAVCWAYANGITTGYENDKTFRTNVALSREQLATFLYRYTDYQGLDITATSDLEGLLNADKVKPYAAKEVKWAVGAGIISGMEIKDEAGNTAYDLAPQKTATRSQMAQILKNFCEAYNL